MNKNYGEEINKELKYKSKNQSVIRAEHSDQVNFDLISILKSSIYQEK